MDEVDRRGGVRVRVRGSFVEVSVSNLQVRSLLLGAIPILRTRSGVDCERM